MCGIKSIQISMKFGNRRWTAAELDGVTIVTDDEGKKTHYKEENVYRIMFLVMTRETDLQWLEEAKTEMSEEEIQREIDRIRKEFRYATDNILL